MFAVGNDIIGRSGTQDIQWNVTGDTAYLSQDGFGPLHVCFVEQPDDLASGQIADDLQPLVITAFGKKYGNQSGIDQANGCLLYTSDAADDRT